MVYSEQPDFLIKFMTDLNILKNKIQYSDEIRNKVLFFQEEIEKMNMPSLMFRENVPINHKYPLFNFCRTQKKVEKLFVEKFIGHKNSGVRKNIFKFDSRVIWSILGILGISDYIPKPIEVDSIGNDFFIEGGHHRFCAYYFLGEYEIPSEVKYYDYQDFLDNAKCFLTYDSLKIHFNGEVHEVSKDDPKFRRLVSLFDQKE